MLESDMKLQILTGSVRDGRVNIEIARWVLDQAKSTKIFKYVELIDIAEWDLPMEKQVSNPGKTEPVPEFTQKWLAKVGEGDAYVIVLPEYNHGYPASLKNALDQAYDEWNHKPVAFVAYGGGSGMRSIMSILPILQALEMVPIKADLRLNLYGGDIDEQNRVVNKDAPERIKLMLQILRVYSDGMKLIREKL